MSPSSPATAQASAASGMSQPSAASKVHNFSAGPAILPQSVLAKAADAIHDFGGLGLSILEISHRSKPFVAVMDEALELSKELLGFGDDYAAIFLQGGASTQFFQVPANLLTETGTGHYLDTGTWSAKAIKESKKYGTTNVVASSKADNYKYIPKDYAVPTEGDYFHLTSNNTIFGTQIHDFPETSVPLVADMSSDIFSREIPTDRFGLIYAGAQKNMGPAGATLVIVRKDMVGQAKRDNPSMVDYHNHIEAGSMFNTPPCFAVYVSLLTMQWVKEQGGVAAMEKRNDEKAAALYAEIDRNPLFFGQVATEDRSKMNACFELHDQGHQAAFDKICKASGLDGLPGHRSVGGYRASIYNALELGSVQLLIDAMQELEQARG